MTLADDDSNLKRQLLFCLVFTHLARRCSWRWLLTACRCQKAWDSAASCGVHSMLLSCFQLVRLGGCGAATCAGADSVRLPAATAVGSIGVAVDTRRAAGAWYAFHGSSFLLWPRFRRVPACAAAVAVLWLPMPELSADCFAAATE